MFFIVSTFPCLDKHASLLQNPYITNAKSFIVHASVTFTMKVLRLLITIVRYVSVCSVPYDHNLPSYYRDLQS
jgi:hypothetical protein